MKEYNLTVRRSITLVFHVNGDSPEDAAQRFQHQIEAGQCSALEDEGMWGEIFYYQLVKGGPYSGEYAVIHVEEI